MKIYIKQLTAYLLLTVGAGLLAPSPAGAYDAELLSWRPCNEAQSVTVSSSSWTAVPVTTVCAGTVFVNVVVPETNSADVRWVVSEESSYTGTPYTGVISQGTDETIAIPLGRVDRITGSMQYYLYLRLDTSVADEAVYWQAFTE